MKLRGKIILIVGLIIILLLIWGNSHKDNAINFSLLKNKKLDNRKIQIKEKIQKKKQSALLVSNQTSTEIKKNQSETKEFNYLTLSLYG